MKFLHLSDLHIGKRVNEFSMLEDQEYILKKINFRLAKPHIHVYTPLTSCCGGCDSNGRVAQW